MFVIALFVVIAFILYRINSNNHSFWRSRDVKGPRPIPFVGNLVDMLINKESRDTYTLRLYNEYPDEKVVGFYQGAMPSLVVRDPEIIKQMLIKEHGYFQDRGVNQIQGVLSKNLFSAEGDTWKVLRQKLSPIFTSGKIKGMLPLIHKSMDGFVSYVDKLVDNNVDHEVRLLTAKYTLDVIGSCAFGVEMNTFTDKVNIYHEKADTLFVPTKELIFMQMVYFLIPGIWDIFNMKYKSYNDVFQVFLDLVEQICKEREGKPKARKDLMELMIELKEQGKLIRDKGDSVAEVEITEEIIANQAMVFYLAGFETSSAVMAFMMRELALNEMVQEKLYEEVKGVMGKYDGILPMEAINEMPYLEMCFDETLRKYAVVSVLFRQCNADCRLQGLDFEFKKGLLIFIPVLGLHYDEKYYDNPQVFDPERFSPENKSKLMHSTYLPFGDGPRNCIGMRFAKVQSMMGMAVFLNKFKVIATEKTREDLEYDQLRFTLTSRNGIWVKIAKR